MNKYGVRAEKHWREWLPEQFAVLAEPDRFFAGLGLWISDEIARLEFDFLPTGYESEPDFIARVGHRNVARLRAEEIVLHLALPTPDAAEDDELPDAWIEIGEALISDVEDVVLPRRTPHRAR